MFKLFTTTLVICICLFSCNRSTRDVKLEKASVQKHQHVQDTLSWVRPRFEERKEERYRMVRNDIRRSTFHPIRNRKILEAMEAVPRHLFIPKQYRASAYKNYPLPIGFNQTISQPLIVAHMTELLDIKPGDKILEIGTGSGYQAAVLSELTPNVYTIEIVEKLGLRARETLKELGYNTVKVKIGDGYEGWPEYAPFDGIIVTCAPDKIPEPLIEQLKTGGKIVIPVGKPGQTQWLTVVEKTHNGEIRKKVQYPVTFVPMTGKVQDK